MKFILALLFMTTSSSAQTPDPFLNEQWYLDNFGAPITLYPFPHHPIRQQGKAGVDIGWKEAQSNITELAKHPVIIAVIDSGVDPLHPELQGRLLPGVDFLDRASPLTDVLGHGTHIAGIIAAASSNGMGVAGITPSTIKILPLRVLSSRFQNFLYRGRIISDYVAEAIRYAVSQKASVINLSLGWPKVADSPQVRSAVREAISAGVFIVAAAGNDHKDVTTFPCAYEGVLCVGAITNTGEASYFSNFGGTVDVLAPGDSVLNLYPNPLDSAKFRVQGYDYMSGTSQATPQISALVGILKSIDPLISNDEIKARLFNASLMHSTQPSALYGVPKINAALNAVTSPAYHPNFKGSGELLLNEANRSVRGNLLIRNVGADSESVKVTLRANGAVIAENQIAVWKSAAEVTLPWTYFVESLRASHLLEFKVEIQDQNQTKAFFNTYRITRDLSRIKPDVVIRVPRQSPEGRVEWFDTSSPVVTSRLRPVATVGSTQVVPVYYSSLPTTDKGVPVQIFNPRSEAPIKTIIIPNIQRLNQVLRMDLKGDGQLAWIFTGNFRTKDFDVFQFQFLAADFTPLYGDNSIWQMPIGGTLGPAVVRDYSRPGSWIRAGQLLVPAILLDGPFPDLDTFPKLDRRRYTTGTHLYYLAPRVTPQGVLLDTRVVDKPKFWDEHPQMKLISLLPLNSKDELAGRIKILAAEGQGSKAPIKILDIPSIEEIRIEDAPEWDLLAATGNLIRVQGSDSSVLFNTFDAYTGAISWSDGNGAFRGNHYFSERFAFDPLAGLRAVFDLGGDPIFFLYSNYRLKAIRGERRNDLPLNRESHLPGQTFTDLLTPVIVGPRAAPSAGIMMDSTLIQGDQISIATWDSQTNTLEKPILYSFSLPPRCLPLIPLSNYSEETNFALPLICDRGDSLEYQIISPGTF